jgi:diamine N-acetyltransferase
MIQKTKNNRPFIIRQSGADDYDNLFDYLNKLSPDTLKRFGPHPFDKNSIIDFYRNADHLGYIAQDAGTYEIIGYSIIKIGYLEHDYLRLHSYGLTPDHRSDCTFAPSVSDSWQGLGVGYSLFNFILSELQAMQINRIILWGGVQCTNGKAVSFYTRNGFQTLGQFEYNGWNWDMILDIRQKRLGVAET